MNNKTSGIVKSLMVMIFGIFESLIIITLVQSSWNISTYPLILIQLARPNFSFDALSFGAVILVAVAFFGTVLNPPC
jgi:hypothetical protein